MAAGNVPTAMARVCTADAEVPPALAAFGPPYVVKDDGLAGGKGVVVTDDERQAREHAAACLARPGGRVVVEQYLEGPEISLFCLTDGTDVVPLAPAQDFKRLGDGDTGPNTGGMGAYSPLPWAPADIERDVADRIAGPVVAELARRGTPFAGLLYCGLALTAQGLRVVEFNARFGDPETQVVLARLATPLGGLLHAAATGTLREAPEPRWRSAAAVTVVVAAEGYPASPASGDVVEGLEDASAVDGAWVLHAGTERDAEGRVVTSGGRVLSVVGTGDDLARRARRRLRGGAPGPPARRPASHGHRRPRPGCRRRPSEADRPGVGQVAQFGPLRQLAEDPLVEAPAGGGEQRVVDREGRRGADRAHELDGLLDRLPGRVDRNREDVDAFGHRLEHVAGVVQRRPGPRRRRPRGTRRCRPGGCPGG